jgi:hypothetical protein
VLEPLESRTLLAGGLASATALPLAPTNPSLGDVAVTSDPGVQQMPSLTVDPADSKHLVIAYMDYSLLKTQ